MAYQLWYWDGIPGRGEFVRLALEAANIPYEDCARHAGADIVKDMEEKRRDPPFAPPYLVAGKATIAQTSNILMYLGEKHRLAPRSAVGKFWVAQVQQTISDMVAEAHHVHHPVDAGAYYEDQKKEAKRAADSFRKERMPKFLNYFEEILPERGTWVAGGKKWSYADLSLFQLVSGLTYAFPKRMKSLMQDCPKVEKLHSKVEHMSELQDYFGSSRRLPFNEGGIFRHYAELD